ncbi:maleylacetoacetate isomerase [Stenotrophomonas maltophilia]|uniref:maleylacetoacetate isomerase n=1 Tax=Stenotrophomonas maltophilia TaxID=40324 RepID=UPI001076A5E8|nr:maleylacetoacetate isomerase [Stenotrophomonas maltophilia]TFZ45027.1 maleylacetoacetate isomerase [Stenotrophomonas maltophilia]
MILYSFFNSSTSYRVRIALALKGLAHELRTVDIRAGEQYAGPHRTLSPVGGVPVLVTDEGEVITQSLAILDYLDRIAPQVPLYPADPVQRAHVLELALLISCDIHPLNNLRALKYLADPLAVGPEARSAWYAHWIAEGLGAAEVLLQRRGSSTYCFGDTPGAADCCLVPQVANALRMGCDLTPYPRVHQIHAACLSHPAFQAAAPERQPDHRP